MTRSRKPIISSWQQLLYICFFVAGLSFSLGVLCQAIVDDHRDAQPAAELIGPPPGTPAPEWIAPDPPCGDLQAVQKMDF